MAFAYKPQSTSKMKAIKDKRQQKQNIEKNTLCLHVILQKKGKERSPKLQGFKWSKEFSSTECFGLNDFNNVCKL